MASYHFTIKVDQMPDKSAISAATHADYINRDGSFTNIDFNRELKKQTLSGCVITPPSRHHYKKTTTNSKQDLNPAKYLYKSIYGSILETPQGIEFTQGASTETKQIALALAKNRYGEKLHLTGPLNEIASLLNAGRDMDYPVEFTNPIINSNYLKLLEENHNERNGIGNSNLSNTEHEPGRIGTGDSGKPEKGAAGNLHLPHLEPAPRKRPSAKRASLRTLLQRNLDEVNRHIGVLLPTHYAVSLEQPGTHRPDTMRRDFRWGTRRKIDDLAKHIWAQADGISPASRHADYINRRDDFAPKGGCIYTNHKLPMWAKDNPKAFFQAADKYERANGTRYREIEFALPNELSTIGQREIIDTFIQHHLANHYYAYAIHDKISAMGNGQHNCHVHIMFSEREIDEIEKKEERTPELFFHRANNKHPERGGCPKAAKWNDKNRSHYLCELRRDYAEIQNEVLEKYHIDTRVDHRSLKDQYEEALKKGDMEAALLLHRLPEEHLGPAIAADNTNPNVISLMEYRAYKFQRSQLVRMIENIKFENTTAFAQEAKSSADEVLLEHEIHTGTVDNFSIQSIEKLSKLKNDIQSGYKSIVAIENVLVTTENAQQLALQQILAPSELTLLNTKKILTLKLDELRKIRTQMLTKEKSQASEVILNSLTEEILHKQEQLNKLQNRAKPVLTKLSSPAMKNLLADIARQIIQEDKPQQRKLWQLINKINEDTLQLKEEMDKHILNHIGLLRDGINDEAFTTQDINYYLREERHILKTAIQRKTTELENIKQRLISPERAILIARSVYLKGAPKKLRSKMRELQQEATRIQFATKEFQAAKAKFDAMSKPKWYQDSTAYKNKSAQVDALAAALQKRQATFTEQQIQLQEEQQIIEAKCNTSEGKEQISLIASRVLKKDQPNLEKATKLTASIKKLQTRLKDITLMQEAIKDELVLSGPIRIIKEKNGGTSARRRMEEYAHSLKSAKTHIGGGLSASLHQHNQQDFDSMDETEKEAQSELSM